MQQQRVKNKAPAPVQITAEQILREANEFREVPIKVPKQIIVDGEELAEHKLAKRKEFEDRIRRNKGNVGNWIKYANWENTLKEVERARSIFERALDVDATSPPLWLHYCEFELKNKNVNHTRNILDRAVTILPRLSQLWFKYVWLEESLQNVAGARQVFARWMQWNPSDDAWEAYFKFEKRYKEWNRAREVLKLWVGTHPVVKNWIKWAKFEEELGNVADARQIYTECIDYYTQLAKTHQDDELLDPNLFISFAKFEQRREEWDRVRAIYKFAIELMGERSSELRKQLVLFEKQHSTGQVDDAVLQRRKTRYKELIQQDSLDYDSWFGLVKLMEEEYEASPKTTQDKEVVRDVYERFISQTPPTTEKRHWRRYIWSWIYYAIWEELVGGDLTKCGQIYKACIDTLPNAQFTFAKIWLLYAKFLIRTNQLTLARKTLGLAIGKYPKPKLYREYIALEIRLREFDRARTLYEKWLTFQPFNSRAWLQFAELEKTLGDLDRARGVLRLATTQSLDMPEVVWKALIDFEVEEEQWDHVRSAFCLPKLATSRFGFRLPSLNGRKQNTLPTMSAFQRREAFGKKQRKP